MKNLIKALENFLEIAKILGLDNNDFKTANNYLSNKEFGLCFDTIITQMFECDIEIDNDIYNSIMKIGDMMNLDQTSYSFMKELIRTKSSIPSTVKDEITKVLKTL